MAAGPVHSLQEESHKSHLLFPTFSYLFRAVQANLHSVPSRYLIPTLLHLMQFVDRDPEHSLHVEWQASHVLVVLFSKKAPVQANLQIPLYRYLPDLHLSQFELVGP